MSATLQRAILLPHPSSAPDCPVSALAVEVRHDGDGSLRLRYELRGDLARMRVPAPRPPGPADGLWAHTCCEAFVGAAGGRAYREFNFSPSGQWAIYDFDDYRARAASAAPAPGPSIALLQQADALVLEATLAPAALPDGTDLQLGLTTVVEAADGTLSYWALRHPGARPDFHLRDAFTLTLARP